MDIDPQDADLSEATRLANQIHAGDTSGFSLLYERVAPALFAWASLRLPRGAVIEDFLQEVWLRGVRALFREGDAFASFRAWIFQVARNVLSETLRWHLRARRSTIGESACALSEKSAVVTNVSTRLESDDTMSTFLEYAQQLAPEDRDLLLLCAIEGRSCAEVAVQVGLGRDAAFKRWQRLRSALRDTPWVRHLLLDYAE